MKTMTVEHSTGETANGYFGHTFSTVSDAINYLERNGGGTIVVDEIDSLDELPYGAQVLVEDYVGETLIVVESKADYPLHEDSGDCPWCGSDALPTSIGRRPDGFTLWKCDCGYIYRVKA